MKEKRMKQMVLALSLLMTAPLAWAQLNGPLPHFDKPCGGGKCGGPPPRQPQPRSDPEVSPSKAPEPSPANQEKLRIYNQKMQVYNQQVQDLRDFNRLKNAPDSQQALDNWLAIARRQNWEGAWINYGNMAWRMGLEFRAMEGYQQLVSVGCPQYPAACQEAAKNGDFLHGKLYPPVLALPSHPYESGEPPPPTPPSMSLAAYQGTLEAYQGQRVFILETKKKLDDDEHDLFKLTEDMDRFKQEYQKMKAAYDQNPSSAGAKSLSDFYKILVNQQQKITDFTAAWAPQRKQNNSDLEVNDASIAIAQQQIRILAASK
jgi:hypothetical protein